MFRIYYKWMNTNISPRALRSTLKGSTMLIHVHVNLTRLQARAALKFSILLCHSLYVPSSILLLRSFISSRFLLQSNGWPTTCVFLSFFLISLFPYLFLYIYIYIFKYWCYTYAFHIIYFVGNKGFKHYIYYI